MRRDPFGAEPGDRHYHDQHPAEDADRLAAGEDQRFAQARAWALRHLVSKRGNRSYGTDSQQTLDGVGILHVLHFSDVIEGTLDRRRVGPANRATRCFLIRDPPIPWFPASSKCNIHTVTGVNHRAAKFDL